MLEEWDSESFADNKIILLVNDKEWHSEVVLQFSSIFYLIKQTCLDHINLCRQNGTGISFAHESIVNPMWRDHGGHWAVLTVVLIISCIIWKGK